MKKYFLFVLFFFSFTIVFGQGKVNGVIISKTDKTPIEYVHIEVRTIGDNQTFAGAVTDANGRFEIDRLPYSDYMLLFSFIGYEKSDGIRFSVSRDKPTANLGSLELEESAHELGEVVVSGQRSTYINKLNFLHKSVILTTRRYS